MPAVNVKSHYSAEQFYGTKEQTVLVVCHGGILRSLYGFMEGRRNGIVWRPKPKNCEIRVYEADERGRHLLEKLQK